MGGVRKNYEKDKFLLKNGEKNICTQAPCIYFVAENVKKKKISPLKYEIFFCHRKLLAMTSQVGQNMRRALIGLILI